MTQQELTALVGRELMIRNARHLCLAATHDALLLLQICSHDEPCLKAGEPVQYIVARHPCWHKGELIWDSGSYYPLLMYRGHLPSEEPSALALLDASLCLADGSH